MKFMIRCDVEGVTGVTTYEQAEGSPLGRAMLMNDLGAVVDGILGDGDHTIIIYDEHTDGRNIDLAALPETVSVICGKPRYRPDWGGLDASFDAMLMVGFHARGGVLGALLAHSYLRHNLNIRINGAVVGEIGMEAAIAGDVGVPLWMVSGDSAGMAEAEALVPGVRTVTVKKSLGEFAALCYPPKRTARQLYAAAEALLADPPRVDPLVFPGPVVIEIDVDESDYLRALQSNHPELLVGEAENTVRVEGETVTDAWSWYLDLENEVMANLES